MSRHSFDMWLHGLSQQAEVSAHEHRQNLIPAGTATEAEPQPGQRPSFGRFESSIDPDAPISLQSVPLGYVLLTCM